jgi:hypothetical protein
MPDIICYMAVFRDRDGNPYDPIRPPRVVDPACRYICYTDYAAADVPKPWERVEFNSVGAPELANRYVKIGCPTMAGVDKQAHTLYLDGVYELRVKPTDILAEMPDDVDVWVAEAATSVHRDAPGGVFTLAHERQQILDGCKADADAVERQWRSLLERGIDPNTRCVRCGIVLRRPTCEARDFSTRWWREVLHHTHRDQLSFHIAARDSGVRWGTITHEQRNRWFKRHSHAASRPTQWR